MHNNIQRLIKLVKEYPVLYNAQDPLYRDKKEREQKWSEISTALDISSDVAKKKWRNLKDCYLKHLKSTIGQASSKFIYWQWAGYMEFLKPYLNLTQTVLKLEQQSYHRTDDLGTQSSSDEQGAQWISVPVDQSSSNLHETTPDPLERSYGKTQLSSDDQATQSSTNLQGSILRPRERSYGKTQKRRRILASSDGNSSRSTERVLEYLENMQSNSHDGTEHIFLGYAKLVKSFSIRRQAKIKMKIAKIMMEEEIAHYEENALQNASGD